MRKKLSLAEADQKGLPSLEGRAYQEKTTQREEPELEPKCKYK